MKKYTGLTRTQDAYIWIVQRLAECQDRASSRLHLHVNRLRDRWCTCSQCERRRSA